MINNFRHISLEITFYDVIPIATTKKKLTVTSQESAQVI